MAIAVDEATRIWLVIRILFDDLSGGNGVENLFNRNPIISRLFVGMLRDPNSTSMYGIGNEFDFDQNVLSTSISIRRTCHFKDGNIAIMPIDTRNTPL